MAGGWRTHRWRGETDSYLKTYPSKARYGMDGYESDYCRDSIPVNGAPGLLTVAQRLSPLLDVEEAVRLP